MNTPTRILLNINHIFIKLKVKKKKRCAAFFELVLSPTFMVPLKFVQLAILILKQLELTTRS